MAQNCPADVRFAKPEQVLLQVALAEKTLVVATQLP